MAENLTFFLNILDIAWFLERFIISFGWVLLCRGVPNNRKSWLRFIAHMALYYCVYMVITTAMYILLPSGYLRWISRIVSGLIPLFYLMLSSGYGKKTNMLLWCCMYAGVCTLASIGGQFSMLIGEFVAKGAPEAIARIGCYLLLVPLGLYLRRFNFDDFDNLPRTGFALIVAGDASIFMLYFVEFLWAQNDYRVMVTLVVGYTCLLMMVLFAVYTMYAMCQEQGEIIALQAEQQRLLAEQETMQMVDSNLEDLRCIRHDLRNQYAYMQILLHAKRYDELEKYFQQVSQNLPSRLEFVDCGNQTMNTILNMEISKARKEQIEVTHQLVIPPVLPFPEKDMCAIIANLMDNAIEECKRISTDGEKVPMIHISIYPQKSYLFIQCKNLTDRKSLKRQGWGLQTTKGDEKLHGYGTRIVSKTAEKYNGIAEYTLEDGFFVAKVLLDMMEGTEYADQNGTV